MSELIEDNEIEDEESKENEDIVGELLNNFDTELQLATRIECLKAKLTNPEMFVSGFDVDDDDDGIEDPEDPDSPGERLLKAAEEGNIDLAEELLSLNPDLVAYKDKDGYTPLHRAAYSDNTNIIRLLISKGAKVDAVTEDGWTALHSACFWNTFKSVRELIDNNADVNAKTNGGQTPLHVASNQQARETMIILLTCPYVNKTATNSRGETPEDMARRAGRYGSLFDTVNKESINKL